VSSGAGVSTEVTLLRNRLGSCFENSRNWLWPTKQEGLAAGGPWLLWLAGRTQCPVALGVPSRIWSKPFGDPTRIGGPSQLLSLQERGDWLSGWARWREHQIRLGLGLGGLEKLGWRAEGRAHSRGKGG
jgi:hypothetical protein